MSLMSASSANVKVPSLFAGKAWQQVLARDARADGQFVYAVKSTKIYCRPSCPSRRPERKQVSFYPTPEHARAAGFRACLRCEPDAIERRPDPQLAAIERVTGYLTEHATERTKLKEVAQATGVAPLTILRGFKRVLGVTPREFAKSRRIATFKEKVRSPKATVTDALYDAGFSSASRLYEDAPETLGMTPTALKSGGRGETLRYALAGTALGPMLIAATARGLCSIAFADTDDELITNLRTAYPQAELKLMDRELSYAVEAILALMTENSAAQDLPLDIRATAFQSRVWRALRQIPRGETRTYSQLAEAVGSPQSVRAVAAACAANPLAVLVPCHRVIGKSGKMTGYRWGIDRKRRLLAAETQPEKALP